MEPLSWLWYNPRIQMKIASFVHLLIAALLMVSATKANAQRESFDASVVRIIESDTIKKKFYYTGPGKIVERRGVTTDGKVVIIIALDVAFTFDDVFFEFDSTRLRNKSSERQLQEMLAALKSDELKSRRFLIEGHTCDIGGKDYNLKLSADRAQAIKDYLVRNGIAPERLAILGCGESEPAVQLSPNGKPSEVEAQRARNRRVVLREMPPLVMKKVRNK